MQPSDLGNDYLPPPNAPQLTPFWEHVRHSDLFRALVGSLAATISASILMYRAGWSETQILSGVGVIFALAFGLVALNEYAALFGHTLGSIAQASAEILTRRDLNGSGGVGDIVESDPDEALEKFTAHLDEFYTQIPIRGVTRKAWLEPPFQWSDGDTINRPEYERIVRWMEQWGDLRNRKQGTSGRVVAKNGVGAP